MDTNTLSLCKNASGVLRLYRNILYKIITHLSGFGVLYRRKQRLKYRIAYTAKHVQVHYKQHNLSCRFLWPSVYIQMTV